MAFQVNIKRIAKNTVTLYVRQAITMLISFFTVRVTLEQLGVEDYGLNNLVGSIVSMFSFINGSMGTAVQRFYSYEIGKGESERLKSVCAVGLYLHLIVALITLALAEIFAVFFLKKLNIPAERLFAAQVVFQISIVTLCLGIITVPYSALLRAREMFSQTALVEIVQAFLRLGILYLLVVVPYDKLIVLSCLNFFISFVGIVAFIFMAFRFEEAHTLPKCDKVLIKEMLKFVSLLLITVLASLVNTQGLVMLINIFFGLAVNGAYAIAVQVQNVVNTFVTNFKGPVVPQLMSSYGAGDLKTMHQIIDFGTKITFLMLLLISIPLSFCTQWVLTLWLKTPPQHTAQLVILVLIFVNVSSFTYFHAQGVHAAGRIMGQQIWLSSSYIFAVACVFIAFKLGFPFYIAVCINIVIAAFQGCVNLYYARKCYRYSVGNFIKNVFVPVILMTIIMVALGGGISGVARKEIVRIAGIFAIDIILVPFLGLFLLFRKDEKAKVVDFVKRSFSRMK